MLIRTRRAGTDTGAYSVGMSSSASISPDSVCVSAAAKINLFLEILGKRSDGFHELQSLLLAVNLCDELEFSPSDSGISLTTDVPGLSTGPDNLICKAAELLRQRTGCQRGAVIRLTKRIPWAAGLGGGSSDGAAALAGLNVLWNLKLTLAELSALGAELGSDVPFFLNGHCCWATGRGEILQPVPMTRVWNFLLVKPPEGLSTADVYRRVNVPSAPVDGTRIRAALQAGDLQELGAALHNRLQEAAFELSPSVAALHARLQQSGAVGCLMSGSGSCLFALVHDASEAQQIVDGLLSGSASEVLPGTRTYIVQSCIDTMPTA
jgi:4-diphosphocytidyl-2-C-methyl-D-erythritol kinase